MDTHHRLARLLAAVLCQLLLCVFLPLVLAESPKFLRIMPMGDSITHGTIPGGYRHPLYDLLTKNEHTFDFVGAKTQRGDTCPDPVSDVLIDQVVQYNHLIGEVIPSLTFTNLRVTIVDHHTASAGKLSDGLHPNREGYQAMARVWYEGITAAVD